jgi:hypothetical protein
MLKKISFAVFGLVLALAFAAPQKARAEVAIGVTIGGPIYTRPVYAYPYAYVAPVPRPVYVYPRPYVYPRVVVYHRHYRPYWRHERYERRDWYRDRYNHRHRR